MYLVPDSQFDDVTLYSVQDCIEHGVMDTVASRETWHSDTELFAALKAHWTATTRYDIGLSLRQFANCCIPAYRDGTLS